MPLFAKRHTTLAERILTPEQRLLIKTLGRIDQRHGQEEAERWLIARALKRGRGTKRWMR